MSTVVEMIDWLTRTAVMTASGARLPAGGANDFADAFDYSQEDRFLAMSAGTRKIRPA